MGLVRSLEYETFVLWLLMAFVQFAVFNFTPFVVPIKTDLSITYTQVGLIQSALFIPYTAVQLLAGPIVDKYPSKKLLVLSAAIFTGCSILFALSEQFYQILLLQGLKGTAMAFIFVMSVKRVLSASKGRSGRSFSFYSSSFAMGPLTAGFVSALYSSFSASWRNTLFTMNVAGIIPLLLLLTINPVVTKSPSEQSLGQKVSSVLATRETWVLGYDQLLRFGVVASFSTWIPTFVIQAHSFSPVEADIVLGTSWTVALFFIPLGGILATRINNKFLVIESAILFLAPTAILLGFVSDYVLWIAILSFSALMNFHFAPLFAILPDIFGGDKLGLVTGIEGAIASVGAFILPTVFGFLRDASGSFSPAWYLIGILAFAGAVFSLQLRSYGSDDRRNAPTAVSLKEEASRRSFFNP